MAYGLKASSCHPLSVKLNNYDALRTKYATWCYVGFLNVSDFSVIKRKYESMFQNMVIFSLAY